MLSSCAIRVGSGYPLCGNTPQRSAIVELYSKKIKQACKHWGKPDPFYRIRTNEVMIGFNTDAGIVENIVDSIVENIGLNSVQLRIIE